MSWLILALVVPAFLGGVWWGRRGARVRDAGRRDAAGAPSLDAPEASEPTEPTDGIEVSPQALAPPPPADPPSLADLLDRLEAPYEASRHHPDEVTGLDDFAAALKIMADPQRTPLERVIADAVGPRAVLAQVAAEALVMRDDAAAATGAVVDGLHNARVWTLHGLLRFLAQRADRPVVWDVLLQAPEYWADNALMPAWLAEFAAARLACGESADLDPGAASRAEPDPAALRKLLARMKGEAAARLDAALAQWEARRVDLPFLRSIGRAWSGTDPEPRASGAEEPVVAHAALERHVEAVLADLTAAVPRSVVLVGEPGVGKSAIVRRVAAAMADRGWTMFEAGATDIMAGQTYLGELEKRMRELLERLETRRRVLWLVPGLQELGQAGRHRYNTTSVLDMLVSAIDAGRVVVLAECAPAPLDALLRPRPRLRFALSVHPVEPLDVPATLALAQALLAQGTPEHGVLDADPALAADALALAQNHLAGAELPGPVLDLLRQARQHAQAAGERRLTRDVLMATMIGLTGLPRAVLDERAGLEPVALREHFARRVMGQPEAVNCLVDRVAMLKAGLVDPRRPIGVFLFAGPTGTGKTEVGKTLAAFLFGSAERMLRLDMSEFQDPSALPRLVGEPGDDGGLESLVRQVRRQPFCVLLLDEFEKAHPRVWDLFLQVFDDGRLTDANGQVADFRHAIIILTSNAGATSHQGASLGFTNGGAAFSEAQVTRALAGLFRPEFLNRIDRVVVFRPLGKAAMRDILRKELGDVVKRRGFRHRDWAVEWEPSALDFLLERGFTTDLGARPLRRAIEEHLLAPLAMTIVEHRFPEGDQFLFVRSDGLGIQVEFIDPDGPSEGAAPAAAQQAAEADATGLASGTDLGRLVLAGRGDDEARRLLVGRVRALAGRLAEPAWQAEKDALLEALNRDGFWLEPGRFGTLDRLERIDHIAAEAEGLQSLARRLERSRTPSAAVVSGLAQRLHLVTAALADLDAGRPGDACLAVDGVATDGARAPVAAWAQRIARMYRQWARRRGLRLTTLGDHADADGSMLMLVSGLGVQALLSSEAGLHVLEVPDGREGFDRVAVRVRVGPQPAGPPAPAHRARDAVLQALATLPASSAVVRRYREAPSPLVRDAVRGWRTGRLGDVLDGNFDLFGTG